MDNWTLNDVPSRFVRQRQQNGEQMCNQGLESRRVSHSSLCDPVVARRPSEPCRTSLLFRTFGVPTKYVHLMMVNVTKSVSIGNEILVVSAEKTVIIVTIEQQNKILMLRLEVE